MARVYVDHKAADATTARVATHASSVRPRLSDSEAANAMNRGHESQHVLPGGAHAFVAVHGLTGETKVLGRSRGAAAAEIRRRPVAVSECCLKDPRTVVCSVATMTAPSPRSEAAGNPHLLAHASCESEAESVARHCYIQAMPRRRSRDLSSGSNAGEPSCVQSTTTKASSPPGLQKDLLSIDAAAFSAGQEASAREVIKKEDNDAHDVVQPASPGFKFVNLPARLRERDPDADLSTPAGHPLAAAQSHMGQRSADVRRLLLAAAKRGIYFDEHGRAIRAPETKNWNDAGLEQLDDVTSSSPLTAVGRNTSVGGTLPLTGHASREQSDLLLPTDDQLDPCKEPEGYALSRDFVHDVPYAADLPAAGSDYSCESGCEGHHHNHKYDHDDDGYDRSNDRDSEGYRFDADDFDPDDGDVSGLEGDSHNQWDESSRHRGTAKKRKSTRHATSNEDRGHAGSSNFCDHGHPLDAAGRHVHQGRSAHGAIEGYVSSLDESRRDTQGEQEIELADHPIRPPKPRIPMSRLALLQRRWSITSKLRLKRFMKQTEAKKADEFAAANASQDTKSTSESAAALAQEKEKKAPTKKLNKAERRAAAQGKAGTSLAALRAKVAAAKGQVSRVDPADTPSASRLVGGEQREAVQHDVNTAVTKSPEESFVVEMPRRLSPPFVPLSSAFTFTSPSPTVHRIEAMRKRLAELNAQLDDSYGAVAAATKALEDLDLAERNQRKPSAPTKPQAQQPTANGSKTVLASNEAQSSLANTLKSSVANTAPLSAPIAESLRTAPDSRASATSPPISHQVPVPKLSRRKKAVMSNVHHRSNYVPSRLPSDPLQGPSRPAQSPSNGHATPGSNHQHGVQGAEPSMRPTSPGLDHPTATSKLFDEWMCVFCEYEMLYGEEPLMLRAARRRVRLQRKRDKAKERAHRAAQGLPPLTKGKAKQIATSEHRDEDEASWDGVCTCGREHSH